MFMMRCSLILMCVAASGYFRAFQPFVVRCLWFVVLIAVWVVARSFLLSPG